MCSSAVLINTVRRKNNLSYTGKPISDLIVLCTDKTVIQGIHFSFSPFPPTALSAPPWYSNYQPIQIPPNQ